MKSRVAPHKPRAGWVVLCSWMGGLSLFSQDFAGDLADSGAQEDLAKKLANPVSSLISVPIQANYDENIGPGEDGAVWRINVQPVIPFSLNEDWNLITRTIVPIVFQDDLPVSGAEESGLGDTLQTFFFSPVEPFKGWIWGVGPAFLYPTATNDALGAEQWGAGPSAVVLKQEGPWTYGLLTNHLQSFAGEDSRSDVSATFLQPFVSYITSSKTTFSLNTESTYDWEGGEWSVPINFNVSQLFQFGSQPVQIGVGGRYWAESPDSGPEGWGFRFQITFLFPK